MRKIYNYFRAISLAVLAGVALAACSKDTSSSGEDPNNKKEENKTTVAPTFSNTEVGENNTKTVQIGKQLHIETDNRAEAGIKSVVLTIQYKGEGTSSFSVNQDFPKAVGNNNGNIHNHYRVPADAKEGDYQFTLTVTDKQDRTGVISEIIKVTK